MGICLDPSIRLIEIGFISGFKFLTGAPRRKKFPVASAYDIASIFVIFNTDVEYDVYIVMVFNDCLFFIVIIVGACGK